MHGGPCSTTLQRTLRARQLWQALDALRFTALAGRAPLGLRPASAADRLGERGCNSVESAGDDDPSEGARISISGDMLWSAQFPSVREADSAKSGRRKMGGGLMNVACQVSWRNRGRRDAKLVGLGRASKGGRGVERYMIELQRRESQRTVPPQQHGQDVPYEGMAGPETHDPSSTVCY